MEKNREHLVRIMGWKRKDYKETQKALNEQDNEKPYDSEMLRIQGLIRCKECEITYPYLHRECPNCGTPNSERYPLKD